MNDLSMQNEHLLNRRTLLGVAGAGALGVLAAPHVRGENKPATKGRIKQSLCRWCYGNIKLEKLAEEAKKIGYQSIELLTIDEYKIVKPYGLTCAMLGRVSISNGLNRKEFHAGIEKELRKNIAFAAAEGIPNVICMSGDRKGMADDDGLKNCLLGLKNIAGFAEEKKVTICMEGLNSKVDHRDYMYDRTNWGVDLCKKLGSPRFKLLYDIYHMQIMEGDVIRTIHENIAHIGHFHTGGVPGRHELDDTQELQWRTIAKAIADLNFDAYFAHEFIPVHDPMDSLRHAVQLCAV
jgi:hydroxypyruvate isomerase